MKEEEEEKEEREMRDVKNTVEGRGKPGKMGQGQSVMSAPVCTSTHLHWFHA